MGIGYIVLFVGCLPRGVFCTFVGIYKVVSTDIPFLYFSTCGQFHHHLVAIPDEDRLLTIHGLTGAQSLGIISKAYLKVLCKRLCQLIQRIVMIDHILI